MKINVIERTVEENRKTYVLKNYEKCCDAYVESDIASIGIGDDSGPECFLFCSKETDYDQYEDFFEPIHFCPFCGAKIECNIVENINCIEEVKNLLEMINALTKKREDEDSVKAQKELGEIIFSLRKELNRLIFSNLSFNNLN